MEGINKQKTGFKFGQHRLNVWDEFGQVGWQDNTYKLVLVRTEAGEFYYSLRLYRKGNHFIKQLLIDIPVLRAIGNLMVKSYPPGVDGWRKV